MENKVMIQFSWILILGTFFLGGTDGLTYANYTSLVSTVLTNYNSDIIPLADHSDTLNVTVTGYLYSLLDVDVVLGTLSLVFALEASWSDSQITWTPSDYGNLASISLPAKQVWTPNFVLGSPVDFTTIGESWQPVTFQNNGDALVTFGDVINSACTFDLKFWPFDKHTCDVGIIAYGYSESQLRLISSGSFVLIDGADNIEWVITKTSAFLKNGASSEVVFRVEIERRSQIFVILIVFPLYSLACLNSFVLILPTESGERIGFSTTLLLSLAVFLETVSGYIPNTSEPIPMLCIVVTLGITMALLCTMTVIISMHYYFKPEEEPIHRYYIRFVKFFNKKFRSPKIDTQNGGIGNRGLSISDDISVGNQDLSVLKDKVKQDSESDSEIMWKDVSYTIDKVMFISSTMGHMLLLIIFTFYINIAN